MKRVRQIKIILGYYLQKEDQNKIEARQEEEHEIKKKKLVSQIKKESTQN